MNNECEDKVHDARIRACADCYVYIKNKNYLVLELAKKELTPIFFFKETGKLMPAQGPRSL